MVNYQCIEFPFHHNFCPVQKSGATRSGVPEWMIASDIDSESGMFAKNGKHPFSLAGSLVFGGISADVVSNPQQNRLPNLSIDLCLSKVDSFQARYCSG